MNCKLFRQSVMESGCINYSMHVKCWHNTISVSSSTSIHYGSDV